jgi:hypothetical protein
MTNLLTLSPEKLRALAILKQRGVDVQSLITAVGVSNQSVFWPTSYFNNRTGKEFNIDHHPGAQEWLDDRSHRYYLAKGGEGSGKSVIGIKRDFDYLKLGNVSGILASPDLPHFKKSLWPEFKAWCPVEMVIPGQRYRLQSQWEPHDPFTLTFLNGSQLICGGMEDPASWEGPNVHFAHLDEARRKKTPEALKVLDGRVRLPLPNGDQPCLWLTSTPRKNWLYEYFGPWEREGEDPRAEFKVDSFVITLRTINNELAGNLSEGYTQKRGQSLTAQEKRVLQEAEWEDTEDTDKFLPSMTYWDACYDPALGPHNPRQAMVLAADGATVSDCFALVGVCRHPVRHDEVAVRYVRLWKPTAGNPVSLMEVEKEIVELKKRLHIVQIAFDPFQLKSMMERLFINHGIWTEEFNQMGPREQADKQLLDMITNRQIWHDGTFSELREHLDNADRKKSGVEGDQKMRIVKREASQKIDGAVALSMSVDRCLSLNLY